MIKYICTIFLSACLLNMSSQAPNYSGFGNNIDLVADLRCLFTDTVTNTLYLGGSFEYADGNWCRGAAKWNGSTWEAMDQGFNKAYNSSGFTGNVGRILRYKNKIYYFGNFIQAGNKFTKGIATWNGTTWDSTGFYPNGQVRDADVYNDTLYICGDFTQIGSMQTNFAAKFDGTTWYPMSFPFSDVGSIDKIRALKNKVYATSAFYDHGYSLTAEYDNVLGWKPSFGVQGSAFKAISGLERIDTLLFFYGLFTHISTMYSPDIAAWSGSKLYGFGIGSDPDHNYGTIRRVKKLNHKIYAMGTFDNAGGMYPTLGSNDLVGIAELTFDASFNRKWCISSEYFDNSIFDAEVYNGDIIVGGNFFKINNDSIKKCAKWLGGAFTYSCNTFFTGIDEISISDNIKIYPNPATSILNITDEQNELQNSTIEIANSVGQTVITMAFNNSLDVSSLSNGCYFLNITTSQGQVLHSRFIKE